jgi:hypothetical protein
MQPGKDIVPEETLVALDVAPLVAALGGRLRALVREELAAARNGHATGFLSVDGTADFLATTPSAIRSLVKRGQLPVHRAPNGRLLFHPRELEEWVRQGGERD